MADSTKSSKSKPGTASRKKRNPKSKPAKSQPSSRQHIRTRIMAPLRMLMALRDRRPHRSFVRTRRRDYTRALDVPGYLSFTLEVNRLLWSHRRTFFALIVVFWVLTLLLGGLSSAVMYTQMSEELHSEAGSAASMVQAGLLALAVATSGPSTEIQQLYLAFMGIMIWLTTVWLLREFNNGNEPSFRDGLYNAGAPIMSTITVVLMLLVQLLPLGLLAIVYTALSQLGFISEGLGAFLFFGIAALVITLTLYWITSTIFALIIITLPGIYPWRAMRAAGDIVVGRRMKILLRFLWMAAWVLVVWGIVVIPAVLLDQYIRGSVEWYAKLQLLPVFAAAVSTVTIVWISAYVYLFYRKVVASDTH